MNKQLALIPALLMGALLLPTPASALEVVDISATQWRGQPALELRFDQQLRDQKSFAAYLGILEPGEGPVAGPWLASDLGDRAYFTNVQAGASYQVTIGAGLRGLDGDRLSQSIRLLVTMPSQDKAAQNRGSPLAVTPQLSLPDHASAGDRFEARLRLSNSVSRNVKVRYQVLADYPLRLFADSGSRALTIPASNEQLVLLPLRVEGATGIGRLHLRLVESGQEREFSFEVPVNPVAIARRFHSRGKLAPAERTHLTDNKARLLSADSMDAELVIAPWPPIDGDRQARLLEQSIPVRPVDRLAQYFGEMHRNPLGAHQAALAQALAEINETGDDWTRVHAAALALTAIKAAQGAHDSERETLLKMLRGISKAKTIKTDIPHADRLHAGFATKAYAAYLLSLYKEPQEEHLLQLYKKQRRYALAGLPLVHLGLAMRVSGDGRRAGRALLEGVSADRADIELGDHGSPVRDAAWIVALLDRHGIAQKYRQPLIDLLDQALSLSRRLGMSERMELMRAADAIARLGARDWSAALNIGEFQEQLSLRQSHRQPVTQAALKQGLEIINQGKETLYWSLDLEGYAAPAALKEAGLISEYTASKIWLHRDQQPLNPDRPLSRGEVVRVSIAIPAADHSRSLRLIERKPAGFEWWFEGNEGVTYAGIQSLPFRQLRDRLLAYIELPTDRPLVISYWLRARMPGRFSVPATSLTDASDGALMPMGGDIESLRIR